MNKTTALAQNPSEAPQKDLLPGKKRSGSIRDTQSDSHNDEADKAQQSHLPLKTTSQFDCSNLGLFFGARSTQAKTSTAELFAGKAPCQKKTSEGSTTKEGNSQKQPSSKDFSNLEELVEDTTIIPNPDETGVEVKKKPIEVAVETKVQADEAHSELVQATSPENALSNAIKKKSIAKFFPSLKGLKEEKPEQDLAGDISKIGFNMDDEQEKPGLTSYTDINASRNNLKVLEVIKKKAVPSRYGAFNPNIYENPRLPEGGQTELRTNNNSVFAGAIARPLPKAVNPFLLQYQDIDSDGNQDQEKFIAQLFGNTKKNGNSGDIPLDKTKEICHADLNPRLLTEKTAPRNTNFVPTSAREHRIKPNVSLVSTDSTVDSEGLVQQNNSFSTPYSVANGSFNNSVKLDGSSPMKMDSGRMLSDNSGHYRGYSMQGNMNMVNQGMSMMNSHRMSAANLNQSCISFLGYSGTNSDHSANMSFNGDDFLSNYNTPQAGQQQQFRGQSFSMPSNSHMMEQQIFMGQPMTEPTTYRSNTDNNFAMMNQSPQNSKYQQERKPYTPNDKNGTKMRRKNQDRDDDHLYQIDLDKLETNGRTTVMIRNIPNKYDLTLILQTIEKNHKGKFDFFYLPIDFSNKCNFGYAFINFSSPLFIKDFYNEFNGKKWEKFNSEKICEIKYGRIQGQEALMQHFQYSRVMNQQDKKLRPYVPTKYGLPNKQKIEELVRQQKLDMSSMKI